MDNEMRYKDMSVEACAKRYEAERSSIIGAIHREIVSSSMSGLEYYPEEHFIDLRDESLIEANMTWDGSQHIDRPDWKNEFALYVRGGIR